MNTYNQWYINLILAEDKHIFCIIFRIPLIALFSKFHANFSSFIFPQGLWFGCLWLGISQIIPYMYPGLLYQLEAGY